MNSSGRILLLSGALLLIVIVAAVALAMLRRRFFGESSSGSEGPLALHEIRAMHARGELDDDEFEQLRRAALAEWGVTPENSRGAPEAGDSGAPGTPENS